MLFKCNEFVAVDLLFIFVFCIAIVCFFEMEDACYGMLAISSFVFYFKVRL